MKLTFTTKRKLQRAGLVALIVLLVSILVWFCWVIWLERFMVYSAEGATLNFEASYAGKGEVDKYRKVLPGKKVAKLYVAEEKFRRQHIRNLGGHKPQGHPQGKPQGGPHGSQFGGQHGGQFGGRPVPPGARAN